MYFYKIYALVRTCDRVVEKGLKRAYLLHTMPLSEVLTNPSEQMTLVCNVATPGTITKTVVCNGCHLPVLWKIRFPRKIVSPPEGALTSRHYRSLFLHQKVAQISCKVWVLCFGMHFIILNAGIRMMLRQSLKL